MTLTAPTRISGGLAVVLAISGCATVPEHPPRTAAAATPAPTPDIVPPRPINSPTVPVPVELRGHACVTRTAVVEARVDTAGRVSRARIVTSSGSEAYDSSCLLSAAHRAYEPGTRMGRPVEADATVSCLLECG